MWGGVQHKRLGLEEHELSNGLPQKEQCRSAA